ncbi:hypothetical protein KTE71_13310 [Burkholderia multivorans]|uniref:hypothetical protein n=1 Tax=Burkholderia multivorans TaxID=87883 RepID=UPI001B93650F|nr:hypothetical protein [Burkholderia multivorans]MBR8020771.1 hypothetical protein [Burkholderia multivorans]MBU9227302.1 hypothetical protein [Burkholderia multivorans]MBU9388497.1 hypothetical protein [Burkholderia multivorans]MDN8032909.1 hypothetical protein [Burkholderia multivorans]HEF4732936.1 hypothetical protein [Burkholderia multivorans]
MPSIHELIAKRREVAAQIKALQAELERLDEAVYGMVENVTAMLGATPSTNARRISAGTWTVSGETLSDRLRAAAQKQSELVKAAAAQKHSELMKAAAAAAAEADSDARTDRRKLWPSVMQLLASTDRPVKTRDLLDQLALLGVEVGGKNPANNLAAHLSSMSDVVSTPEGWVLSGRKL